jgi:hypothetical protein
MSSPTGFRRLGTFQEEILLWFASRVHWFDSQTISYDVAYERLTQIWFQVPNKIPTVRGPHRVTKEDLRLLVKRGLLAEHYSKARNRFYLLPPAIPFVAAVVRNRDRQLAFSF